MPYSIEWMLIIVHCIHRQHWFLSIHRHNGICILQPKRKIELSALIGDR